MKIKEMSLEEKYAKLFDYHILSVAANYAFNKELGTLETLDKWVDYSVKVDKKMLPSFMAPLFKLMKIKVLFAPGRTFKQFANQMMYLFQVYMPLSSIELSWVSDREAVMRIKNCEILRRSRELVKKAGLDIDPKELCEIEIAKSVSPEHVTKDFGIDLACELEENGCTWTAKLK